ncbi:HEAT repeat domain-containing protein [Nostoc sp.]|uniref:HEAT repeat domain-containing protein n=1 Tax=Nostoc sp. TaxID=1180 RepID=UPI002FFD4E7E
MNKQARLLFLGLLKVCLLGVAFPLLLTTFNWAQANTKQDNSLLYAQTPAPSKPQPSKPAEVKKTNPRPQEKKQEEGEKSDPEKKQDLSWKLLTPALGVVVILYLGVLWLSPFWLLKLPKELKVPKIWIFPEFKLPDPVWHWLKYQPRVLDAWVEKHIDIFNNNFDNNETVSRRKNYISLPVDLLVTNKHEQQDLTALSPLVDLVPNKYEQQELTADYLRITFKKDKRVRLLIWGDGGTGKTTIACQIAKWAMTKDKEKRLAEHLMLPVLIEQELKSQSGEGIKALMEDIVGQIQELTDGEQKIVDELLVEQLLRKRRILLIVDRFSEMNDDTRQKINPNLPEFPANALVVTSRIEEGNITGIDIQIKTLRLDGVELTNFIKQYLIKRNKWELFENDQDKFLKECAKLTAIVGDKKTIIVLLAKLYAERMINGKENLPGTKRSPDNIPDLIIEHLETLNSDVVRRTNQEYHTVQPDAKLIAWQCLQQDYKPNYVDRVSMVAALGEGKANNILEYFEKKLYLIKSGQSHTIRFALDTLAEYLAGLYLVEYHKDNETNWREFITKVDPNPDKREEIKGFLLAVRECCITKGAKKVPSFVAEELGELAGLDLEALKQEQLRRRIESFIDDLFDSNLKVEDRLYAVQELEKMAEKDKYAVDGLLLALTIDDVYVRCGAVAALGNLGDTSEPVLNGLLASLQDQDDDVDVRRNAVVALGKLGNTSEPVLNRLLALLQDQDEYALHDDAATALDKLGNASKLVLHKLLARLQDQDDDVDVRGNAAAALGKLGKASKPVLDELLARLQDQDDDVDVRRNAVEALGNLGNASEPVMHGLLERLQDQDDDDVRRNAVEALGKLGNSSEPVMHGLLARLQDKDDDVYVRGNAAEALGKLGNASKPVMHGLLARLQDKDDHVYVRKATTKALEKLSNASNNT